MFQALIIKALLQLGSSVLLNLLHAGVTTLQARQDNDLDIGAETVKLILKQVNVTPK